MGISVVQAANANNIGGSNNNIIATFGANITPRNAVIVFAQTRYSSPLTFTGSIMLDGPGDSFTLLQQVNDASNTKSGGFWFVNSSLGGSATITFNISSNPNGFGFTTMVALEVSGLSSNASDVGSVNAATGSASCNTGSFSTSQVGDLIIGAFCNNNQTGLWTAGTSPLAFTIPTNGNSGSGGGLATSIEYAVWSGVGSMNPSMSTTFSSAYMAIGWSFLAAPQQGYGATGTADYQWLGGDEE
jgi:hypothetical protein